MKKNIINYTKACFAIMTINILTGMVTVLPWWSFVIPVLLSGMALPFLRWNVSSFPAGFLSGFIVWVVANASFDLAYNGMLAKIGLLLSVQKIVVLLAAGLIGGLLNGLALYTGKSILTATTTNSEII